jgi:endonuclease I
MGLLLRLALSLVVAIWSVRSSMAAYEVPNPAYAAPPTYYNSATGTGATLKTNLRVIIIGGGFLQPRYEDVRDLLDDTDKDPNNPNNVLLIYNRLSVNGTWDGGVTYNREHIWADSRLGPGHDNPSNAYRGPASDLFNLRPCTPSVNSDRGNANFGITNSSGSFGDVGSYWFPGDQDKGDVARAMFYMATCYTHLSVENGNPAAFQSQIGDLQALLKWHYADGIDNFERRRNDVIQDLQNNRNPFVDHPEYVWTIFGKDAAGVQINNSSQISVAAPDSAGTSTANINLGRIMMNGSFGTSNVTFNKTGTTPTTFDITTTGSAITLAGGSNNLIAGVGQGIDYNAQSRTITVGLNGSSATNGLKSGTITIDNTDLTTAGAGQGSADGNDSINVFGAVLANRVVTPSLSSVNFGVVMVGSTVSSTVQLTTTGDDNSFTRVYVAGSSAPDANGMQLTGSTALFDSASATSDRNFGGILNTAGAASGNLSLPIVTAENSGVGLAGEGSYAPLDISYVGTALDHANASFNGVSDTNTLTLDFGSITVGSGTQNQGFSLHNLLATAGFTSSLDLLSITPTGDTGVLMTDLTAASQISDLSAGNSLNFVASLSTSSPGTFSATYAFDFSDDTAVFGAVGGQILTLNLLGVVSGPLAGDFDSDGDVDGADFVAWQTNFPLESGATLAMGDADADGDVDGADFVIWQTHFPTTPGPAAVPEPAAALLLLAGAVIVACRRVSPKLARAC